MALWSRLTGAIAAIGIGRAGAVAIEPALEAQRQEAWSKSGARLLALDGMAGMVAQGLSSFEAMQPLAQRLGYDRNRFGAAVQLALKGPGTAALYEMRRRDLIGDDAFRHGLAKQQIEPDYWQGLHALLGTLLSPAEVANAVQQGHLPNPGILPDVSAAVEPAGGAVAPATPDGQPPSSVPLTQIDLDPIEQVAGHGLSVPQLRVLANLAGLPPGPEALLSMWNRGLLDESSVNAGIREGHMKTKWAGAYKRLRWAVLSGQEYAEAHLRDWITEADMYAGGALTGHTKHNMDLFYRNRGRPATPRQLWLAWARKVPAPDYPGEPANGRLTGFRDHELAIRRSNIRPEYAGILWAVRFNYPSLFQLNRMVEAGSITPEQASLWASYNLEAPEVVQALADYWRKSRGGGKARELTAAQRQLEYEGLYIDRPAFVTALEELGYPVGEAELYADLADARRVKAARERAISTVERQYVGHKIDRDTAQAALELEGLPATALELVMAELDHARAANVARLTPAQIVKAYKHNITTEADALAELEDRGYSADDAARLLAE